MILFFCYSKPLMKNISFVLEMKKNNIQTMHFYLIPMQNNRKATAFSLITIAKPKIKHMLL